MPAYINTNVELLDYNRKILAEIGITTSPLIMWEKKGNKAWHPRRCG
ncbi:hypothetical protein HRbin02_01932 [Candidatus Calditenuaceae archaeon HR02]|nr:hypothetical protein HRbin02_01932 [Candidatus Calditenuaceae archaeon HR02]